MTCSFSVLSLLLWAWEHFRISCVCLLCVFVHMWLFCIPKWVFTLQDCALSGNLQRFTHIKMRNTAVSFISVVSISFAVFSVAYAYFFCSMTSHACFYRLKMISLSLALSFICLLFLLSGLCVCKACVWFFFFYCLNNVWVADFKCTSERLSSLSITRRQMCLNSSYLPPPSGEHWEQYRAFLSVLMDKVTASFVPARVGTQIIQTKLWWIMWISEVNQ